jgi:hypothetical protein
MFKFSKIQDGRRSRPAVGLLKKKKKKKKKIAPAIDLLDHCGRR